MIPYQFVLVGDALVGKSSMVVSYEYNTFEENYYSTGYELYAIAVTVGGVVQEIALWDIGVDEYYKLRQIIYTICRCFLICFSVDKSSASYENVYSTWVPEVKKNSPNTPIVLVATKIDLRENPTKICYSTKDGEMLRKKVKAQGYVECSALHRKGLEEVMQEAVNVCSNVLQSSNRTNCKCTLL